MPTADIGNTGRQVSENVRRIRLAHEISLRELSAMLAEYGRPILPSGLLKIEHGERRVDVDDLVALAEVLGTTPTRLLNERPEPDKELTAEQYRRHRKVIDRMETALRDLALVGLDGGPVLDYLDRVVNQTEIIPVGVDDGQR
jgi:transcriptional regulator with XRE-family HTH domain